jgi:hypothetical protein
MPSHRPAFRSRAPLSREGITHLGDERVHRIHVACIYLIGRCKLGNDLSRHHRAIGAAQHVEDTATTPVLIGLVFVVLGFGFGESGYALLKRYRMRYWVGCCCSRVSNSPCRRSSTSTTAETCSWFS